MFRWLRSRTMACHPEVGTSLGMTTYKAVRSQLAEFQPRSLSGEAWANARADVLSAVDAAEPSNPRQATVLASRLCSLLAWTTELLWDRSGPVDLDAVLTREQVSAFASASGMPSHEASSRASYRVALTRVLEARAGVRSVRHERAVAAPAAALSFWPRVVGQGPFPVLVQAYRCSGGSLHATAWSGLVPELVGSLNLASLVSPRGGEDRGVSQASGTVRAVQAAAAMLRDAMNVSTEVITAPAQNKTSGLRPPAQPGARRPSAAAARRAAKEAAAARVRAESGLEAVESVSPDATAPGLSADLVAMLTDWSPDDVDAAQWALISDAVSVAVRAYQPTSPANLRNVRSIVVSFAAWVVGRGTRTDSGRLGSDELLAEGLIDAYLAGPLAERPDGSRATIRSVLRRVVRKLAPDLAPEKITYQPVQPPYSATECARLVLLARQQPTDPLQRSLSAVVALGLGAGLGAEDQRVIAPCHVREVDLGDHGTAVAIDVPGARARTVIVREEYEELLRDALALHAKARRGNATPLYGMKPDRKNGANRVAAKAVTATGTGVEVSAARLRSTWLVACMSASVPLGALLHASGLKTPRTFADLLPYCPAPDPEAVAGLLRSLRPAATGDTLTGASDVAP